MNTIRGLIFSRWKRTENAFVLDVKIPVNCQAKVSVSTLGWNKVRIEESGSPVWENNSYIEGVDGISEASEEEEYVALTIGSGSYSFRMERKE